MCSAWARRAPAGSNTAAEQSARSLMFGLNAPLRSTAPISAATPESLAIRTLSSAADSSPCPVVFISNSRVSTSAPRGPGRPVQPSGTQMVQSSLVTALGPINGSTCLVAHEASTSSTVAGEGDSATARNATTSTPAPCGV